MTQKKKFCKICPRQIPEEVCDRGALQAHRLTFTKKLAPATKNGEGGVIIILAVYLAPKMLDCQIKYSDG